MSSLPQLGQDRWPGVTDPPRPAVDMSGPARSRRRWVRLLGSVVLLTAVLVVLVWWRHPVVVTPDGYLPPAAGTSSVAVRLTTGVGDVVVDASARETADRVEVLVKIRSPRGSRPAVGIPVEVTIPLERPLDDRTVVDGRSGVALPQLERQP